MCYLNRLDNINKLFLIEERDLKASKEAIFFQMTISVVNVYVITLSKTYRHVRFNFIGRTEEEKIP